MSMFVKVAIGLALSLPLGAYVLGTLASADPEPVDHTPIILQQVTDPATTSPSPTPSEQPDPDSEDEDEDEDEDDDDTEVVRPGPVDPDDDDDDDLDDRDDRDDDDGDDER